jgi:nitrite reductase (NADH) small subunit
VIRQLSDDRILVETGTLRVLAADSCPHRGGRLRFAQVNDRRALLTCPLHQATFDLRTGDRVAGPVCAALRVTVLPNDTGGAR